MEIVRKYLTVNGFSRTGKKRSKTLGIIIHNIGVPNQKAESVIAYFESLKNQNAMDSKPDVSASAQYVIDLDGTVYQIMGEDERAYHCGTSKVDPISGFIYTEKARDKFGQFATFPDRASPNACTIGIELCHKEHGVFTSETIGSAVTLCAALCKRYGLNEQDIMTHNEVVGWKNCPELWTKRPALLLAFKEDVRRKL